ncbi:DNA-binding MarR family transcriptional regulator [Altererythrobacter atlanticus]|uniref:Organic hydroperoxide resistance transcriptional regulator n=1 Tax=Croceibacterium atlanticum TaxID=1267766 RepID=A0A0F7KTM6_9SPHN|nr:MarR family transcriptional regulator [Croceibacterium atlanticum]AKH42496.1 Organic hydroperoxide resistance transcriptional regulator [Croceibacterium atlanticum]MBB5731273.1 DNA-binding MarR family transcriptional regulator [Croceibacterium atlanticum]
MTVATGDMRGGDPLLLDRQLCFQLYAASNMVTRLYGPVLADLGLTYPQYLVMLVLWEEDGQTVGALGKRLYLDSGTLTPLLKRMEGRGLIERGRDPDDERRVLVTLTEAGRALRAQAVKVPEIMAGEDADLEAIETLREAVRGLVDKLAELHAEAR